MDTKVSECENLCPKCNSENIEFGAIETGDAVYFPAICKDCGCKFKEYLTYDETEWQDCEHSFVDSDNEGEYGKEHCRFCEFERDKQ